MSNARIVVGFDKKDPGLETIKSIAGVKNVDAIFKGYLIDIEDGSDLGFICNKIEKIGGIIFVRN
jgi:hypothetical protein